MYGRILFLKQAVGQIVFLSDVPIILQEIFQYIKASGADAPLAFLNHAAVKLNELLL